MFGPDKADPKTWGRPDPSMTLVLQKKKKKGVATRVEEWNLLSHLQNQMKGTSKAGVITKMNLLLKRNMLNRIENPSVTRIILS